MQPISPGPSLVKEHSGIPLYSSCEVPSGRSTAESASPNVVAASLGCACDASRGAQNDVHWSTHLIDPPRSTSVE